MDWTSILPTELKCAILFYVPSHGFVKLTAISRAWRDAARADERFLIPVKATIGGGGRCNRRRGKVMRSIQPIRTTVEWASSHGLRIAFGISARQTSSERRADKLEEPFEELCNLISGALDLILRLDVTIPRGLMPRLQQALSSGPASVIRQLRIDVLDDQCAPGQLNDIPPVVESRIFAGDAPLLHTIDLINVSLGSVPVPALEHVNSIRLRLRSYRLQKIHYQDMHLGLVAPALRSLHLTVEGLHWPTDADIPLVDLRGLRSGQLHTVYLLHFHKRVVIVPEERAAIRELRIAGRLVSPQEVEDVVIPDLSSVTGEVWLRIEQDRLNTDWFHTANLTFTVVRPTSARPASPLCFSTPNSNVFLRRQISLVRDSLHIPSIYLKVLRMPAIANRLVRLVSDPYCLEPILGRVTLPALRLLEIAVFTPWNSWQGLASNDTGLKRYPSLQWVRLVSNLYYNPRVGTDAINGLAVALGYDEASGAKVPALDCRRANIDDGYDVSRWLEVLIGTMSEDD